MKSNSDYAQDLWVLKTLKGKRGGFFIEAGASDGIGASNTLLMERQFGWRGLLVEPGAAFFNRLRVNRPGSFACQACLSDKDEPVDFWAAGYLGAIKKHREESFTTVVTQPDIDGQQAHTEKVEAISLRTLFKRYEVPGIIDYFSLDVEGSEFQVLSAFPFDTHQVLVFTIESRFMWEDKFYEHLHTPKINTLLTAKGYTRVAEYITDDHYVANSLL